MSVVLRLHHENHAVMLLPGDLDDAGLADLITDGKNLQADILLFPHHGGHIGHGGSQSTKARKNAAFARTLVDRVKPKLVLFSIGRGRFSTPRPEIMKEIQVQEPNCHIQCTQLSEHCQASTPSSSASHLGDLPAIGLNENKCCGGSLAITLAGKATFSNLDRQRHIDFVNSAVATPLCKSPTVASRT